jgi:hypothetical protein
VDIFAQYLSSRSNDKLGVTALLVRSYDAHDGVSHGEVHGRHVDSRSNDFAGKIPS